jgi:hypothetical protein
VQRRENQADSDPRLQSKPFIYRGFLEVGSQSFTGIFTCLAARSETGHCTVNARPLLAYATDAEPDTLIIQNNEYNPISNMSNKDARRLPVVSHGAEFLAIGYLMRRNILTYKAPPNNEGYDLICIHPDPRQVAKQLRVQVKSRYQTDCDRAFPVKKKSFDAFDYLLVVFQNIGFFFKKNKPVLEGYRQPEFYCFPNTWIREHHKIFESGWEKVHTKGLEEEIEKYKNECGFDLIANDLGISYPSK